MGGRVEACREGIHEVKDRRRAYYSLAEDLLAATRRWSNANQCAYIPFTCLHYVVVNIIQPVNKTILSLFDFCESSLFHSFAFSLALCLFFLPTAREIDGSIASRWRRASRQRKETNLSLGGKGNFREDLAKPPEDRRNCKTEG